LPPFISLNQSLSTACFGTSQGLLDKFLETCQSDIDPETDDFSSKYSDNIREHWRAYMDGISGGETDLVSAGQEYYKAVSGNIMDGGEDLPEEEMTKAANGLVEVVRACCQEDALDKDAAKAALMPKLQESGFVYKPDTRM